MGENNVYRYLNITALPKFSWLIIYGGKDVQNFRCLIFYTPPPLPYGRVEGNEPNATRVILL